MANNFQSAISICTQSRSRTGTSFTPLVFETSASTDSAIWACRKSQFRDVEDGTAPQIYADFFIFYCPPGLIFQKSGISLNMTHLNALEDYVG